MYMYVAMTHKCTHCKIKSATRVMKLLHLREKLIAGTQDFWYGIYCMCC